ncbi:MAG: DMT family protein [Bacteroidales bacterium]|nr:DMT family protein [Candidatus Scybalocola fimicaballi]
MRAFLTILLLIWSNVVMTFAWYGNLKIKEMRPSQDWPLYLIILCSWGLALFEYCFMIPANRIGSKITGGPFSLMQLKIIQEAISLIIFTIISTQVFNGEALQWNHIVAFVLVLAAVAFAFVK